MTIHRSIFLALALTVLILGVPMRAAASGHVVGSTEIQQTLERQASQPDADREAIQTLLRNPQVRRIAGSAGLDLTRASAAAATLSGSSLAQVAAQAREMNERLAGGDYLIISTTAIIIALLIIILLTR